MYSLQFVAFCCEKTGLRDDDVMAIILLFKFVPDTNALCARLTEGVIAGWVSDDKY